MQAIVYTTTWLPQNEHALNQAARDQLLKADQPPAADLPYVAQLVDWALGDVEDGGQRPRWGVETSRIGAVHVHLPHQRRGRAPLGPPSPSTDRGTGRPPEAAYG